MTDAVQNLADRWMDPSTPSNSTPGEGRRTDGTDGEGDRAAVLPSELGGGGLRGMAWCMALGVVLVLA